MRSPLSAPKRQRRAALLLMAVLSWAPAARSAPQDAIVGTWLTEDGSSRVEVGASGGASPIYGGKVVWLKEATPDGKPLLDIHNGDPALRGRPILGLPVLTGFKATPAGGWSGGTIYAPRAGKSYPADLSLAADGRLQIKVQAGLLSKTLYWTR